MICHHLNVERADWDLFSRWAETTFLIFSSEVKGQEDRIVREIKEFSRYITALIDERRTTLATTSSAPHSRRRGRRSTEHARDGEPHPRHHCRGH